ncbi:LPS export ABC transporter periplasmic protein LptC [candidate division TA06 bacterium]|uniref:LPS export ABC transporter periplasmic protein LptC n=1 Tax=candidate division TA06 bacterium TaxID=2250710 RepID=A0A933MKC1_UNCT6|nr:LPS export ABC transporter periplasmic protein LptC [candidate division TA06 bacterium]
MMKRTYVYIAIILMLLTGCKKEQASQPAVEPDFPPSQTIQGFKLTETQAGKRSWVLVAEQANTFNDQHLVEMFKLKIDFYRKAGDSISATMTADSGKINTETRNMETRQNVVLTTNDGLRLLTNSLDWSNKDRRFTTESKVRLEKDGDWLEGEGMTASPDLKEIEIKRNVRGKKELLTGLEGIR